MEGEASNSILRAAVEPLDDDDSGGLEEMKAAVAELEGEPAGADGPASADGGYGTRQASDYDSPESLDALSEAVKSARDAPVPAGSFVSSFPWGAELEDPPEAEQYRELTSSALMHESMGRLDEAEKVHKEALELRKRVLVVDHPELVLALNNLASLHKSQGPDRLADAQAAYEGVAAIRRRTLPPDHPDLAATLNHLALVHDSKGEMAEAERYFAEVLAMRKRSLPPEHPDVATSLNNLALVYETTKRYPEAEEGFAEALAIRRKIPPFDHPHIANSITSLASVRLKMGRPAEAAEGFAEAERMYLKSYDTHHTDVANVRQGLENCRILLGRKARPKLRHSDGSKVKPNDKCPFCDSGKKFKKCCGGAKFK